MNDRHIIQLMKHRVVMLSGQITAESAGDLIAQLLLLDADDGTSAIDLYINSSGGEEADACAVVDAIHCLHAPVRTICLGQARGAAASIMAAGQRGHRYAGPGAKLQLWPMGRQEQGEQAGVITAADAVAAGIIDRVLSPRRHNKSPGAQHA